MLPTGSHAVRGVEIQTDPAAGTGYQQGGSEMRRTRMLLAGGVVALALSTSGTGVALAQSDDDNTDLAEQCGSYNFIEWLLIHHECHGHDGGPVYWPSFT
jgi:hypothetical protein